MICFTFSIYKFSKMLFISCVYFIFESFNFFSKFSTSKTFSFTIKSMTNITKIILFSSFFIISYLLYNTCTFVNSTSKINTINRVNIKVRTSLRNPIIRNNNSRTKRVISKTNNFHNTYRLFTFSRNTITNHRIKTTILKFFKKFFISF